MILGFQLLTAWMSLVSIGTGMPPPHIAFSKTDVSAVANSEELSDNPLIPSNTGGPIVSCTSTPDELPPGLRLLQNSCGLAGIPTQISASTMYTIIAHNSEGDSPPVVLSIAVMAPGAPVPPNISYAPSDLSWTTNSRSSFVPVNTGGPIISFSIDKPDDLPNGIIFDTSTGEISGTPTETFGTSPYVVTATNSGGVTSHTSITMTIKDPPPHLAWNSGNVTAHVGDEISIAPINSGGPIASCTVNPELPPYLELQVAQNQCRIFGELTVPSPLKDYTVTAHNDGGDSSVVIPIAVLVNPPALQAPNITGASLVTRYTYPINPPLILSNTGGPATACESTPLLLSVGLRLDVVNGTCQISGTPNTIAEYPVDYTIRAGNAVGYGPPATLRLTINNRPPIIALPTSVILTKGAAITRINPTKSGGGYGICSISPTLPGGVFHDNVHCGILGTPTSVSAPTLYTMKATNSGGDGTATITITVIDAVPTFTYAGPVTGTVGNPINIPATFSKGTPTSCSSNPELPTNLSLNQTTCAITGTPNAASSATTYTITGTNSTGSGTATVSIGIVSPLTVTIQGPDTAGVGDNIALTASASGAATYQWSKNGSTITGATSSTYVISNAQVVNPPDSYQVTATNLGGSTVSAPKIITVHYLSLSSVTIIGPTSLHVGESGAFAISETSPSGVSKIGSLTYDWRLNGQSIATTAGVNISSAQFTQAGDYQVVVTNSQGSRSSNTIHLSVVNAPPVVTYPSTTATSGLGVTITPTLASGGAASSYARDSTTPLPPGLSLNLTTGVISGTLGTVSASTTYSVTIIATNDGGSNPTTASITVNPPPPPTAVVITNPGANFGVTRANQSAFAVSGNCSGSEVTLTTTNSGTCGGPIALASSSPTPSSIPSTPITKVVSCQNGHFSTTMDLQEFKDGSVSITADQTTLGVATSSKVCGTKNTVLPVVTISGSSTAKSGQNVSYTAFVTAGSGPFNYQWFMDNSVIAGATSATLILTNLQVTNSAHSYRVTVTNAVGSADSNSITLTVSYWPLTRVTISGPAQLNQGQPAVFSATIAPAVGTGSLSYSWQKNGVTISTASSLNIANVSAADTGDYRLIVGSSAGSQLTSSTIHLTVIVPPTTVSITPLNAAQNIGESVTFTMAQHNGSEPLSYLWRHNGVTIPGAVLPSLTLGNLQASDAGGYTLVISNNAGSAESGVSTITFNTAGAFSISISGPEAPYVGQSATLRASVAGTSGAVTYRWKKNGVAITGATDSTLTLANLAAIDVAAYTVVATNNGISAESSAYYLRLAPKIPEIKYPTADQINTRLRTNVEWEDVNIVQPNSITTYSVIISTASNCSVRTYVSEEQTTFTYTIPVGFTLEESTDYYVCVKAKNGVGESAYSEPRKFTTRGRLEAPALYTRPATSPESPSGQQIIVVGATGGEEGSLLRLYQSANSGRIEIGSTTFGRNAEGRAEIVVTINPENLKTEFFATTERCIQEPCTFGTLDAVQISSPSATVAYYYDDSLRLAAPELQKNGDMGFKWAGIEGALSYKIYRRIGLEACKTQDASGGLSAECYLTSPFKFIGTFSSADTCHGNDSKNCSYRDSDLVVSQEIKEKYGISYFVTAHRNNISSNRSRAIRFTRANPLNPTLPPITPREVSRVFIPAQSGHAMKAYLCGTSGSLEASNYPDLGASVQYAISDGNCDAYKFDSRSQSKDFSVDELNEVTVTGPGAPDTKCVFAGEIMDLADNANYCMSLCLSDEEGRLEQGCTPSSRTTLADQVAPDFNGITSLVALSSGVALRAFWQAAADLGTEQSTAVSENLVQYEVRTTKDFDSAGKPAFKDAAVQLVKNSETSAVINGLLTDTLYCVQVTALDNQGNRSTEKNPPICTRTLNNRPSVRNIRVSSLSRAEAYKLVLRFVVIDRQADLPNHSVLFDSLEYKVQDGDWIRVADRHVTGFDPNHLKASTSMANAEDNDYVFDSIAYLKGKEQKVWFRFKVKTKDEQTDILGNTLNTLTADSSDWGESDEQTIFQGMSSIGSFGNESLSSCALNPRAGENHPGVYIWIFIFGIMGLIGLRIAKSKGTRGD